MLFCTTISSPPPSSICRGAKRKKSPLASAATSLPVGRITSFRYWSRWPRREIAALRAARIPIEIIPGVTAALGAAAGLQISLTARAKARRLQFITAHAHDGKLPGDIDWQALCDPRASTVVYMGVKTLEQLAERLLANGMDPSMPALLVERATCLDERNIFGTIENLAAKVARAEPSGPCVILIGEIFPDALSLPRTQIKLETQPQAP